MRAVVVDQERPGELWLRDIPAPVPSPTQLLVGVRAAGVNRADLSQREGRYWHSARGPQSTLQPAGFELAGEVLSVGPDVRRFAPGDRVMALTPGAYAEAAAVDEGVAMPIPTWCSFEEAAAIPVAFMTEHDALVTHGHLRPGADVLITAAAAGVSLAALQIARVLGARRVLGTVLSSADDEQLMGLGLTGSIDAHGDVPKQISAGTDGEGVSLVVDHVGGPGVGECLKGLAVGGRLISVGRLGGTTSSVDLDFVARRRLSIVGVSFRTRGPAAVAEVARRFQADLSTFLDSATIAPVVDKVFAWDEAATAQDYLATSTALGKVVLSVE